MPRKKEKIDPSKPLKNPRHEIMARKIANGSTQVEAYKTAYPKASDATTRGNASRLIAKAGINERALKLLDSVGLSEAKLARSLNKHVDSTNEQISLKATETGFKLLGYGNNEDRKDNGTTYNPVQIIIKQMDIRKD